MSIAQIALTPTWAKSILNDVRLESTMADLIEVWVHNGDITQPQAEQLSMDYGIEYPYGFDD